MLLEMRRLARIALAVAAVMLVLAPGVLGQEENAGRAEFLRQKENLQAKRTANFAQAVALLREDHTANPDDSDARSWLARALMADGAALFAAGNSDGALVRMREVLSLDPGAETASLILAELPATIQLEMLVRGGEFKSILLELDALRQEVAVRPALDDTALRQEIPQRVQEMMSADPETRWELQRWLIQRGELSVPELLPYLRNERDDTQRTYAIVTLSRMRGDPVLAIMEGMESDSEFQRMNVALVLGATGDPRSLGHLAAAVEDPAESQRVRAEAERAIATILGGAERLRAAEYFYKKALDFHRGREQALRSYDNQWIVWQWDPNLQNVRGSSVPTFLYPDRLAEVAATDLLELPLDPGARRKAMALLVTTYLSQYHRAATAAATAADAGAPELDQVDEVRDKLTQALVLGRAAGQDVLSDVIVRSVADGDDGVALEAIETVRNIRADVETLALALVAGDRRVRFAASIAALELNPSGRPFRNSEHVIPNLVDALSEVGARSVLVIEDETADRNFVIGELSDLGLNAYGADTGLAGLARATQFPRADVIVVGDTLSVVDSHTVLNRLRQDFRTAGIPLAVLAPMERVGQASSDFVSSGLASRVLRVGDRGPLLQGELDMLFQEAGPLDRNRATTNATAAAAALALSKLDAATTLWPVGAAVPGLLKSVENQADEVRVPALVALQKFGDESSTRTLRAVFTGAETSDEARAAAARALGAVYGRAGSIPDEVVKAMVAVLADEAASDPVRLAVGAALGEAPLTLEQREQILLHHPLHPAE